MAPVNGSMMKLSRELEHEISYSRQYTDIVNYKRARNRLQNLIKNKKRNYITNKLSENIAKLKELLS